VTNPAFNNLTRFHAGNIAESRLSVLLKGVSGSGKTHASLTFPEPILSIYADVNRETMRRSIDSGVQVEGLAIDNWADYSSVVMPEIVNRKVQAATIVVDTIDFLADLMWRNIQGTKHALAIQDFGTGLRRLGETTRDLVASTIPRGDHPGYHIVVCSHLKDVSDDGGALLKIAPAIMGQFANTIEDYFDYVLLCRGELTTSVEKDPSGRTRSVKAKQYKILSVPPDRYHTCKGGGLPPELVIPEGARAFDILNEYWKVQSPVSTPETQTQED
jgi:hypothetical protein